MPPLLGPRAALLAGPVALAFFAGGYGDGARLAALVVAGAVLAWAALAAPARELLPRTLPARVALLGLVGLAAWVAASRSWAPLTEPAGDDAERLALYALVLPLAAICWRPRAAARWVEPIVALGTLLVTGWGLAGRLLPGIVELTASRSAGGRLEQPLTYWNASGLHAAFGLVLCARIAGDRDRPAWMRATAAGAGVPLLAGVYLSFSRGAIAALVAGLLVLIVVAPTWTQLRAAAITLEAAAIGLLTPALSDAVRALKGSDATRQTEGLLVLLGMLAAVSIAVGLVLWAVREERRETVRLGRLPLPRWAGTAALALIAVLVCGPVLIARGDDAGSVDPAFGATSARLASAGSHRYDYWKLAVEDFADAPLVGIGTGGYAVSWLADRTQPERVRDVHSLPVETLAELGLVGFLLFGAFGAGVVLCARRVQGADPALAAGPIAALVVWGVHASIDWDWELPAVTLPALVLGGMLLARADAARA